MLGSCHIWTTLRQAPHRLPQKMPKAPYFPLETIKENAPLGVDPWLSPAAVASVLGVDEKWLANAREGRKELKGPPYIKMGQGKTSPVRYKLSSLIGWMSSFPEQISTTHARREVVAHRNFANFMDRAAARERWLFAIDRDGRTATEVFAAIALDMTGRRYKFRWLTHEDYGAQRFIQRTVNLDAGMLKLLLDAGKGNISAGLKLLVRT